ncbi:MAG: hypothetical protein A3B30_01650 [Candidatus Komeilibacteria bacterium RIFCSPLOWO2_01_FULL_52_15]|uniref:Phosphoribosyltransferase domain-containing protein n=2 Tax=Candidatus Komeiliibacteriota TaxID=1817908 RepID=A0A1G2BS88_9BACT|nr:MAG: hypothetical protein A2677_00885 [Candidatus Komeilibacteria bacterium RIFCSPHIGHO2_01_FULL_52_14]OGY92035.1 MAG: hypothetical protein A3B30_01650 [Candidatus Komeilibacteria bacterium RIFCSPLOWO2_01_FULL_52_15]
MSKRARSLIQLPFDPLDTLRLCGGYYRCPKNVKGKRFGPLVGYAGTYEAPDGSRQHYVGDVFYNFARVEQYPHVRDLYAHALAEQIEDRAPDVFLGAPMGGILLAEALARIFDRRVIFAEKKTKKAATEGLREESALVLDRHGLLPDDSVMIVEDVCNNFTTTRQLYDLVQGHRGIGTGVVCAINRSAEILYLGLGVWGVVHLPTQQYRQDDPEVAADIAAGNVVWKPKDEWEERIAPHMK